MKDMTSQQGRDTLERFKMEAANEEDVLLHIKKFILHIL